MPAETFPSNTFTFGTPDVNGNYFPLAQAGQKEVNGIAQKVTWGGHTLNLEVVFKGFMTKSKAEAFIQDYAEKVKALANIFFDPENTAQMRVSKKGRLKIKTRDGSVLKNPQGIVKELENRKKSLEFKLKTLLTPKKKNRVQEQLTHTNFALNLYKKRGIFRKMGSWFRDVFIVDAAKLAKETPPKPPKPKKPKPTTTTPPQLQLEATITPEQELEKRKKGQERCILNR